jgi:hypothetical protein
MTEVRATNTAVAPATASRQPKGLALRICLIADRVGEATPHCERKLTTLVSRRACEPAGVERLVSRSLQFLEIDHQKTVNSW